jgi:hypothetical protein
MQLCQAKKAAATNKCTSTMDHFNGNVDMLEQCARHCLVQHVWACTQSLWTLPSGEYLIQITPAATRVAGRAQQLKNRLFLLAISIAVAMHQYNTVHITQWIRSRAFLEPNEHHHRVRAPSNRSNQNYAYAHVNFRFISLSTD